MVATKTESNVLRAGQSTRLRIDYATLDQWQPLVERCADATPLHCTWWLRTIERGYRLKLVIPALLADDQVVAGVPFFELNTLVGPPSVVAAPFCDSMSVLAATPAARQALKESLPRFLAGRYRHAVIHAARELGGFPVERSRLCHFLDTDQSYERIRQGFSRGLRDNLRQARRAAVLFSYGYDRRRFDIFRELYTRQRHAQGLLGAPRHLWTHLFGEVVDRGHGFTAVVEAGRTVIAAGVFLEFNRNCMAKYFAHDPAYQKLRPGDALFAGALRDVVERDIGQFNFGATEATNGGLLHYKRKWGTQESTVGSEYILGQPRSMQILLMRNTVKTVIQGAIRRAPLGFSRWCSDVLSRYTAGNAW